MSIYAVNGNDLTEIANAIRAKRGMENTLKVSDMAEQISLISGGGGIEPPYIGENPVLLGTYSETYHLADTSFVIGSTAPSSTTTILSPVSNKYQLPIDFRGHDIIVIQEMRIVPTHSDDATGTRQIATAISGIYSYSKPTIASLPTSAIGVNATYIYTAHYNASNAFQMSTASTVGMYASLGNTGLSSASSNTPTLRLSTATLGCRATSITSVDNMKKIIDCIWEWNAKIYQVDAWTSTAGYRIKENCELIRNYI